MHSVMPRHDTDASRLSPSHEILLESLKTHSLFKSDMARRTGLSLNVVHFLVRDLKNAGVVADSAVGRVSLLYR